MPDCPTQIIRFRIQSTGPSRNAAWAFALSLVPCHLNHRGSWTVVRRSWESWREFVVEPPSEAISIPVSHTSGCIALYLIATHRSQSLVVAVAKHSLTPSAMFCHVFPACDGWKNTEPTTREPSAPWPIFRPPSRARFWVPTDRPDARAARIPVRPRVLRPAAAERD